MNYLEDRKMIDDLILKEVRDARESILASHDYNIESYFKEVMEKQWKSGHRIVTPKPRDPQQGVAPNAYSLREKA